VRAFPSPSTESHPDHGLALTADNLTRARAPEGGLASAIAAAGAHEGAPRHQADVQGTDADDRLKGTGADDMLDGGAGADTMLGGAGDDTYRVDNLGDVVKEGLNRGNDTVLASVSYHLVANVENLTLTGTANLDGTGNQLDNLIIGNAGDNTLSGWIGADTLVGGLGDDTYVVDNPGDVIVEAASEGHDSVRASISWALGSNLEDLTLVGPLATQATGNELDNQLTGTAGANVLDGGLGADTLSGAKGDDTYIVDNVGDVVREGLDAGNDTVLSSISWTLTANVENLTLSGSGNTSAQGNALDNLLTGNDGDNRLAGGNGNDTLLGGDGQDSLFGGTDGGNDQLDGGAGSDRVNGGAGNDLIKDSDLTADTLAGSTGDDTLQADWSAMTDGLAATLVGGSQDLAGNAISGFEHFDLRLGSGDDAVTVADGVSARIDGGMGNDTLTGGSGDNTLIGGEGDDLLFDLDASLDTLDGGNGQDVFVGEWGGVETEALVTTIIAGDQVIYGNLLKNFEAFELGLGSGNDAVALAEQSLGSRVKVIAAHRIRRLLQRREHFGVAFHRMGFGEIAHPQRKSADA
jgi:Ca2+-binding RTX toxin-like protein